MVREVTFNRKEKKNEGVDSVVKGPKGMPARRVAGAKGLRQQRSGRVRSRQGRQRPGRAGTCGSS